MTAPFVIAMLFTLRAPPQRCAWLFMTTRCARCWPWLCVLQVINDHAPADPFPGCGDLTIKAGQRVAIEKRGNDHFFGRFSCCACVVPWCAPRTV